MNKYIVGIGAANVDIHGTSRDTINLYDSNPGHMKISTGGVTRNILENYVRLGGSAKLMTVVGKDLYGEKILSESAMAGIDITHVKIIPDHASSTYMSILDNTGEMVVALSDMTIMEKMTLDYLKENDSIIRGCSLIVCDPSIPGVVMDEILKTYSPEIPVFLDPVKARLRLTQSTRRDRDATLSLFLRMHVCFSVRWKNRMLIISKVYPRQYL